MNKRLLLGGLILVSVAVIALAIGGLGEPRAGEEVHVHATGVARLFPLLPVGKPGPFGLAFVGPDRLWVAFGKGVAELDVRTGDVMRFISLPAAPYTLRASFDRKRVFADSHAWPGIWTVDVESGSVVSELALDNRVNDFRVAHSGLIFATDAERPVLWRMDPEHPDDREAFELPEIGGLLVLGADDTKAYVGSGAERRRAATLLYVLDTQSGELLTKIPVEGPTSLRALTVNAAQTHVYVAYFERLARGSRCQVLRVDTRSDEVDRRFTCALPTVHELAVDEGHGLLFASCYHGRGWSLAVVSLPDGQLIGDFPSGEDFLTPWRGHHPLLAASGGDTYTVWVFDVESIRTLHEPGPRTGAPQG